MPSRPPLKQRAAAAEAVHMRELRNNVCVVIVIAAISAIAIPACAGYAGLEGGPSTAAASTGFVGGVIAHLKREDDEAEVKEIAEHQPPIEERRALREGAEEAVQAEAEAREPPPREEEG